MMDERPELVIAKFTELVDEIKRHRMKAGSLPDVADAYIDEVIWSNRGYQLGEKVYSHRIRVGEGIARVDFQLDVYTRMNRPGEYHAVLRIFPRYNFDTRKRGLELVNALLSHYDEVVSMLDQSMERLRSKGNGAVAEAVDELKSYITPLKEALPS
ncbi:MAG: hypothetical protein ACP5LG_06555 [Conexivisphaera sp.]